MARKLIEICIEKNSVILNCSRLSSHRHFLQFTKDKKEIIELYKCSIEIIPDLAKHLTSPGEIGSLYLNFTGNFLDQEARFIEIKDEIDEIKK